MSEETEVEEPVSEVQESVQEQETQEKEEHEEKMVPLSALQAERKKRQQYEAWIAEKQKQQQEAEENDDEWLSRGDFKTEKTMTKREILEEVYCDSHPERIEEINKHLEEIVQRKPWLGDSIATASNRYARAWEIVQDYKGLVENKQKKVSEAKKMVENAKKPGSPAAISRGGQGSQAEFLLSMRGKKEFREYRKELLGRR